MDGLGAVLILAAAGIIGFAMAGNVQRQKRILRDLHGILIRFRAEIHCSRPPLVSLCRLAAKSTHGAVAQSFYLLADELERDKDVLNAFDQAMQRLAVSDDVKKIWSDVANSFTRFDSEQLERILDNAVLQMERLIKHTDQTSVQTARLCRVIGVCVGIVVVILLA